MFAGSLPPDAAVAAPGYQAAGTADNGTGSATPTWPTHAVGDVALLFVESTGGGSVTLSSNTAGFVEVANSPQSSNTGTSGTRLTVFWARATSTAMATPTIADAGNHVYARILTYRGVIRSGNPWDVTGGGSKSPASSSLTVTGITTTVPDTLIVQAAAHDRDNTGAHFSGQDNGNLTGISERTDAGTTSGNGGGFAVWDGVKSTAGASGDTAVTLSSSVENAFLTIALRPDVPQLLSATQVCGTTNQVELVFNQPVSTTSAQNAANYALSGDATVSSAALDAGGQVVTLTTSALVSGQNYVLTVSNITGTNGVNMGNSSQASFFTEGGSRAGLSGSYFANTTLTGTAVQRIDGPVNFDWGNSAPGVTGIAADTFSIRWEGFVTPFSSGSYTFRTNSDDGVRLSVNGTQIINNWTDHAATTNDSAAVALTAGQRYAVTMEFYENGGQAVAQLSWSGPDTNNAFQFIPRASLSHFCGAPMPRAVYKLDESAWSGSGAVIDSSGNGFHGTAMNGAVPVSAKVCNGVQLNGSDRYIEVSGLSGLLNATASLTFWIKTTQTGNDTNYEAPGVTGVEQSGGADDIFWGWLDAGGRIGISVGNTTSTKSATAINNGVWRHVALTRDHVAGSYKIYIDGVLDASGSIATGAIGTSFSSIGRIEDTGGTPVYLNGQLDEVRVYDGVLTDSQVVAIRDITRNCPGISHIRLEHNGKALTCEPATVKVRACADATCSTEYQGSVTTVLSPVGWLASDTISFSGGSTTAQLRKTVAGTVTLSAGTTSPAASSGTLCFNGGDETCNLDFLDTGFIFSSIPTQVAGTTSTSQTLRAVQKSDTALNVCQGLFKDGEKISIDLASECINPTTCQSGQQVTITNNGDTAIAANPGTGVTTWTAKSMTFGANSTASFTLNYPDVGSIRLSAQHNLNGSGNYMSGTSNDFVVKPAGFVLSDIKRTSDSVANPAAADAAGTIFMKAGDDITLTATAVNSAGNATPNYGRETTAEGIKLTSALVTGLGLTENPALGNNVISGSFSAGAATVTNVTWGEVGIMTITPSVGDGDYLGAGDVTGTTTGNIGRFTPHHFDVSTNMPAFATACTGGGFTYIGQSFNYATGLAPVLTVTAKNKAGGTTANYKGTMPAEQAFFKVSNTSLTGKAYAAATGTFDVSGITGTDPVVAAGGNGTATLTFGSGTGLMFTRAALQDPFNAEISLAINVIDDDGVAYSTNPAKFGQASAGNGIGFTTGKAMRYGRLRLLGASGSQLLPLRIPFETQYWTGTFFATNTDDSCTTITSSNVGLGNYIGNLSSGETTVSAVSALTGGRGQITLSAPGAGNDGSVDLALNLGNAANAAACPAYAPAATGRALPHLRGQWCGTAYDKDPAVRVRFGIRRGSDEQIDIREIY